MNWFIHQEQELIAAFRTLEIASQRERERMANKCATLQRIITSTHTLRDAGSQIQSSNDSFIDRLTTELAAKESDIATISESLPSFLSGWETVKNAAIALQGALVEQLGFIDQHTTAVEEEWEITKELSGHMSHSVGIFSTTINEVQKNKVAIRKGFLHPIRRLPTEILQHIFEECVDAEAAEWFVGQTRLPTFLKSATRIAGTCRSWRTIAQQTPRMWNRLRAPVRVLNIVYQKELFYNTVGQEAFCGSLRLCGSIPLEVTVPESAAGAMELDFTSLNIDRLNFHNPNDVWHRLSFPSPRHLWVGRGGTHVYPPGTVMLPSSLISRTTTITIQSLTVTIPKGNNPVTQLVLCGVHDGFRLTSLLESLPCLTELDAGRVSLESQHVQVHQVLTHRKLQHLRIPMSCMGSLEGCLAGGLQLPNLRCFGLTYKAVSFDCLHSFFPLLSAQLPTTVTHLEVYGGRDISKSNLIETFHKIDTISTYGSAVGTVLRALCRTKDMPDGEKSGSKENLPSSIQALHIHDYLGDGEDFYPALHQIYNNSKPIKVFFENCPNILPTTRREFTHVQSTATRPPH